jgi:RimJ/RimL family protein N-acetyltransferase
MITTARLRLRRFTLDDVDRLVDLDNDPEVMAYLDRGPGPTAEHVRSVQLPKIISGYAGSHGTWAADRRDTGEFVGWLALNPRGNAVDDLEIGWRLRRAAWGHGFATEGARALLDQAFAAGAARVTAETMAVNTRSRAVMERLGLRHVNTYHAEFDDPIPGTELGEVVYAITRAEWSTTQPTNP